MARKKKKLSAKTAVQSKDTKQKAAPKKSSYKHEPLPLKITGIIAVTFILLSFVLYGASMKYGFVLDDKIVLSENNYTKKGLAGIGDLFSTDSFQGYFGEQKEILQGGRYRPLSLVSFAIEHEIFGLNPSVYHFNNILLYGFSIFICFIALRRILREKDSSLGGIVFSISLIASLLFLFHPLHTEAVANIKGRDEIMSFLFSMLCLFYSIKFFDEKKRFHLIFANLFMLLGLFSKENTITFLAIIPVAIILFRNASLKQCMNIVLSLLSTTIIYIFIRIQALGYFLIDNPSTDIMNNPFVAMSSVEKYSTIMYTLLVYLKLIFVPIELTHDYYPFHIPTMGLGDWQFWLSFVTYALIVIAIIKYWKSRKELSFGLFFYIAALSIVSNIVINVGTTMNERFIFTAMLGILIIMAYLLRILSQKQKFVAHNIMLGGIVVLILALYGFKTIDRVPAWESELALNQAAIKVSKNSARANSFMATAYFNRYKETTDIQTRKELINAARPYAERAVELYPNYMNANLMLAGIAAEEYKLGGDITTLLTEFKEIAGRRPDVEYLTTYLNYLNDRGNNMDQLVAFYYDIGLNVLMPQRQRVDWAVHYLLMGNKLDPSNQNIRAALVRGYELLGRNDLANQFR